jgi:hypothetical protein
MSITKGSAVIVGCGAGVSGAVASAVSREGYLLTFTAKAFSRRLRATAWSAMTSFITFWRAGSGADTQVATKRPIVKRSGFGLHTGNR